MITRPAECLLKYASAYFGDTLYSLLLKRWITTILNSKICAINLVKKDTENDEKITEIYQWRPGLKRFLYVLEFRTTQLRSIRLTRNFHHIIHFCQSMQLSYVNFRPFFSWPVRLQTPPQERPLFNYIDHIKHSHRNLDTASYYELIAVWNLINVLCGKAREALSFELEILENEKHKTMFQNHQWTPAPNFH